MMTRTKDTLKAAIATHAQTLSVLQDQADREGVVPTDGTQVATALYALTLQAAELAEASWAMRQTMERFCTLVAATMPPAPEGGHAE